MSFGQWLKNKMTDEEEGEGVGQAPESDRRK